MWKASDTFTNLRLSKKSKNLYFYVKYRTFEQRCNQTEKQGYENKGIQMKEFRYKKLRERERERERDNRL